MPSLNSKASSVQEMAGSNAPNYKLMRELPTVKEFEGLMASVDSQLSLCQREQENLRSEIQAVVTENQSLSEQLQNELSQSQTDRHFSTQTLKSNLEERLDIALQEKNSAVDMWQTAVGLVTTLENELEDYRNNTALNSALSRVNEVKEEYSRAIRLLEEKNTAASARLGQELSVRRELEVKLSQLSNDYSLLKESLDKRTSDLDKALISEQTALKRVEELEIRHAETMAQAKESRLSCAELEAALERSLSRLEDALTQEAEAREKVAEALQIVDAALMERDHAFQQVSQLKDESCDLRKTISELITEAGAQVQAEGEQIKEMYNSRIKLLLQDMQRLQEENKSKSEQLQKFRADWSNMENQVQSSRRELGEALRDRPSISALDRKLEGLFRVQDLARAEAVRVELEREQLQAEIIKLRQNHELDIRQYNLEKKSLEDQIRVLQGELDEAVRSVSEVSTQLEGLSIVLRHRENELSTLKQALQATVTSDSASPLCNCQARLKVLEQFDALEKSNRIQRDLQKELDKQRELAQKWRNEAHVITSKFESRIRELKSQSSQLRKQNRDLHNQLQSAKYHSQQL